MRMLFLVLPLCVNAWAVASPAPLSNESSPERSKVATVMPTTEVEHFALWDDSNFSTFFYDTRVDFSRYDKAIFFPMTFDRMELSNHSDEEFRASWNKSSFDEMDKICQFFDDYIEKKFARSKVLESTRTGGSNVLAIEFRMKDFMPTSMRREDALDTVGQSNNNMGVGVLTFQAVLVESQSGNLVAVIEDGMEIKSSSYSVDDRVGRNLAWKRSFQRVVTDLHKDIEKIQSQSAR